MEVAPGVKASEWLALELDNENSADWNRAVEIFEQRIRSRYLDPADLLVVRDQDRPANRRRFGFTILAIDCLVVETLQAFREGKKDTRHYSRSMFRNFLTQRPLFRDYFNEPTANRFYEEFRCGILHQGEIRGDTRLWSVGPLVKLENNRMTVNRSEFHVRLRKEFLEYIAALRGAQNHELRANFRRKMNYVCGA